jgi:hypothetical protein
MKMTKDVFQEYQDRVDRENEKLLKKVRRGLSKRQNEHVG